jgi:glutamate 5-kinase
MFHGREIKRVVVKVGTSTLTHQSGHLNMQRIDHLCRVLSDIKNSGIDVVLVTSGAITAGVNKLKLKKRPEDIKGKQAAASVGQSELMFLYDKFFSQYGYTVAQLLLTKSVTEDPQLRENVTNTLETLLNLGAIPVINENDAVAVEEIVYGDNDMLSAVTANLINADLLIILSDIDGLYEENPSENPDARLIAVVDEITPDIEAVAGGSVSGVGTGGMVTKINAAKFAVPHGTDVVIANGDRPEHLYEIIEGKPVGTLFKGVR